MPSPPIARPSPKKVSNTISTNKNSDSTEEEDKEDKWYSTCSPYYRGLIDYTLVVNREKLLAASSPVGKSHAATSISIKSQFSFIVKMQEWSTCFLPNKHAQYIRSSSSSSLSSLLSKTKAQRETFGGERNMKDVYSEGKNVSRSFKENNSTKILNNGKPLREKVSPPQISPPSPPPQSTQPLTAPPQQSTTPQLTPPPPPQQTSTPCMQTLPLQPLSPAQTPPPPRQQTSTPRVQTLPLQPLSPAEAPPTKKKVLNPKETGKTDMGRKFIWADKYRPYALKDFICNRSKAIELQFLAKAEDCRHFILEGLPGVGKRTMIWALLREAFGPDKVQAREECKQFDLKGEAVSSILVNVKESPQHVEVNLSELKGYEKHVVVELINETNTRLSNKSVRCTVDNCRAIILYEADKLSTDALLYIKWLLERYKGCNKVFFCCNDISKLQPIKSLCTVVQLLPPSNVEIVEVLEFIAKQEGIELPLQLAEKIANNSKNNLRQAIRSFEATWQSYSSLKEDEVILTGWEDDIATIAKNIVEEQSPKQLYNIRRKLRKLIEHNVSPDFIFNTLVRELKKHVDKKLHLQIDSLYEEYNEEDDSQKHYAFTHNQHEEMNRRHNDPVTKNVQHYMRIEEFTAKFMSCYKGCTAGNTSI